MHFCQCAHEKREHNAAGRCVANTEVVHEGQLFIRQCGCMTYREDSPKNALRNITPEALLNLLPLSSSHIQ